MRKLASTLNINEPDHKVIKANALCWIAVKFQVFSARVVKTFFLKIEIHVQKKEAKGLVKTSLGFQKVD